MSGKLHAPTPPLMSPEQAGHLLDELVYERVLACIDLDALFQLEQELGGALIGCGVAPDEAPAVVDEMFGRAFSRIRDEPAWWSALESDALECDALDDDCPLCRDLAREAVRRPAKKDKPAQKA